MDRQRFLTIWILLPLATLLGSAADAQAQGVTLDPTFGDGGIATFDPGTFHANARGVVTLDDNSVLFCGSTLTFPGFVSTGFLLHVLEDGTQDLTYAGDGVVWMQYGENTYAYGLIRLADGKLLVAGTTYLTVADSEFFVARFNADGTVDTSFGVGGVAITAYSGEEELNMGGAMVVQPDGAIVLAGRTYAGDYSSLLFTRFTPDGDLDTTFGDSGYTMIDASIQDQSIQDVDLLSDGSIIGVGHAYFSTPYYGERVCVAKLDSSGVPVDDFGTGGFLTPAIFDDISAAQCVLIQDDELFLSGYIYDDANDYLLFVARLDDAGEPDPSFGDAGISTFKQSDDDHINLGYDLMIPPADGKIYVCGTSGYGAMTYPRDFILLRFQTDGQLDPTFNGAGYIVTSLGPDFEEANAMALQPDGRLVLAGFGKFGANNDAALVRYIVDDLTSTADAPVTSLEPGVLLRASPNPFSASTSLLFSLDSARQLKLEVYDLSGRRVAAVPEGLFGAGQNAITFDRRQLRDGVYFCRLWDGSAPFATERITIVR